MFCPDDTDLQLLSQLRRKVQDPYGLRSDYADHIPTIDIFNIDPDTFMRVIMAEHKEVWYFFSPKERQRSPWDLSVGEGLWGESSPPEDIVDEQGQKIGERRKRRYLIWTMHELRLVDQQDTEMSSTAQSTIKNNNPPNNQECSNLQDYVLCKIFEEEDQSAGESGVIAEAGAGGNQVGHPISSPDVLPSDDRSYCKDPAKDYKEKHAVTAPLEGGGPSSSTKTTAASRPRESGGPSTLDRVAPRLRRSGSAPLPDLKGRHLAMNLPFEPLPWLGRCPTKGKTMTSTRMQTCGDAEGSTSGLNPESLNPEALKPEALYDLLGLASDSGSSSAEGSTSPTTDQKDEA